MPECPSTNDEVRRLYADKADLNGAVMVTDHQTAGRGQRGNRWEATSGLNLTFSVMLRPAFLRLQDQFLLNVIASLALAELLADLGIEAKIKWPNDVMIEERKISGILLENQVSGNKLQYSIVGIGLNVNQEHFNIPTATSLKQCTGNTHHLASLLSLLLEKLEVYYLMLRSGQNTKLLTEYERRMYWRGEKHSFATNNLNFTGEIHGIDQSTGALCMLVDGEQKKFEVKQVVYLS